MKRTALAVAAVGAVVFAVLTVVRLPWDPVPGGPLSPLDASAYFTPEELGRSADYTSWARIWSWSSLAVSLGVASWLGFSSYAADRVGRLRGPWWWKVVLAVTALALVGRAVTLPFAVLLRQRALDYGLSSQAWVDYAEDVAKGFLVDLVATALAVLVLVAVARVWPRAWPAVAGGLVAVLVLVGSFVYPLLVEPLFNRFSPLPDGQLRSQVLALADEEGVEVDDVLVADASRRTTTLNAYVSGFGSSRRVVLYDNLVEGASAVDQREALSVVAHELSHARHDDVLTGSLLGAAGALAGVGLLGLLLGGGAADPRRVPRLLALVAVASFLALPVQNGISRSIETRADVDALGVTRDPDAFIALQQDLARRSLADVSPPALSQLWFGSHPTTLERIALALRVSGNAEAPPTGR